jgi:hypothetical protein
MLFAWLSMNLCVKWCGVSKILSPAAMRARAVREAHRQGGNTTRGWAFGCRISSETMRKFEENAARQRQQQQETGIESDGAYS